MNSYRINAVMSGALYLLGTVFGIWGGVVGGEVLASLITGKPLADVDILSHVAADSSQLTGGAFFTLLMGISLAAMTIFLYPIFKKDSQELAAGLLLFRGALEGTAYFVSTLGILAMVALGKQYGTAGNDPSALQSMGNALYQIIGVIGYTGTVLFITGAMCLYISFFRTRLIPRWLTIWGLVGVIPYLTNALLHFFHVDTGVGIYLEIPLAIQELAMGLWLVIRGFNQDAVKKLGEAH